MSTILTPLLLYEQWMTSLQLRRDCAKITRLVVRSYSIVDIVKSLRFISNVLSRGIKF